MTGAEFLGHATVVALILMTLAMFITVVRLLRGPTLPDRILALDLLTTLTMGYVGIIALRTGFSLYVDIAIALALAGFVATVALARFVLVGPVQEDETEVLARNAESDAQSRSGERKGEQG